MPASPNPLSAQQTLEREWLQLRADLLGVAATLDRLDRVGAVGQHPEEQETLRRAIEILSLEGRTDRAEQLQVLYSRPYDPTWRERFTAGESAADGPSHDAPAGEEL